MRFDDVKRTHRKLPIVVAIAAAAVVAATALGYWTSTGSGSASASVSNPDPVTLAPGSPTGLLYPGTLADVAVEITNPNPFPVNVPSLVLDTGRGSGGFAVDGGLSGCGVSALSYTTQDNGGLGWTVPAAGTPPELSLDLADAIGLATGAATECQGATFTIYLAVGS